MLTSDSLSRTQKKLNHLNWFHSLYDHKKSKVLLLLLWKSGYHITKYKTSAAGLFHAKFLLWSQPLLGQIWHGIGHAIPSMVVMH